MANEQNVKANENRDDAKTQVTVNRTTSDAEKEATKKSETGKQIPSANAGARGANQKSTDDSKQKAIAAPYTTVVRSTTTEDSTKKDELKQKNAATTAGATVIQAGTVKPAASKPAQANTAKPAENKPAAKKSDGASTNVTVTRSTTTADAGKKNNAATAPAQKAAAQTDGGKNKKKKKEADKPPYSNMKARSGVLVAGFTLTLASFILTIICALFLLAPGFSMAGGMSHLKTLSIVLLCAVITSFVGAVLAIAGANTKKPMAKGSFFMGLMAFWFGLAMLLIVLFIDNFFPIDALVRMTNPAALLL